MTTNRKTIRKKKKLAAPASWLTVPGGPIGCVEERRDIANSSPLGAQVAAKEYLEDPRKLDSLLRQFDRLITKKFSDDGYLDCDGLTIRDVRTVLAALCGDYCLRPRQIPGYER